LWVRLSVAFSLVVLLGVIMPIVALNYITESNFGVVLDQFQLPPEVPDELVMYYRTHNGWAGIQTILSEVNLRLPRGVNGGISLTLADEGGIILFSGVSDQADHQLTPAERAKAIPIVVDGRTRGYVQLQRFIPRIPDQAQQFIIQQVSRILIVILIAGGVIGILAGTLVSRTLTAPLAKLAAGAREFQKDLSKRIEVKGSTEVRQAAVAFNEMAAALQQAETQRRNLTADVAHELRTPLTVLRANLQALLDGVYPLTQEEIQSLMHQTDLLNRLVNDLHELAQAEARQLHINRQPVDLRQVVESAAQPFETMTENHQVRLICVVPPEPLIVAGDANRLQQVVNNLLQNALTHTPDGGEIEIRLDPVDGSAQIAVRDSGSGIAPEHLPHVFDRFYRADRSRTRATGGAGLGLTIVKAIVELHGGVVRASSDGIPGRGSTFIITLPLI
jgi:signal transduction histidine kinase